MIGLVGPKVRDCIYLLMFDCLDYWLFRIYWQGCEGRDLAMIRLREHTLFLSATRLMASWFTGEFICRKLDEIRFWCFCRGVNFLLNFLAYCLECFIHIDITLSRSLKELDSECICEWFTFIEGDLSFRFHVTFISHK